MDFWQTLKQQKQQQNGAWIVDFERISINIWQVCYQLKDTPESSQATAHTQSSEMNDNDQLARVEMRW